jgi:L-proline---[L-prolyl-carrier protein] ligase
MLDLDALLSSAATEYPDRTAVRVPTGGAITYREFDEQASQTETILERLGVNNRDGNKVEVHTSKLIGTVATVFGVLSAGAVYVPVDPSASAQRYIGIMSDCSVKVVLNDDAQAMRLEEALGHSIEVLDELVDLSARGPKHLLLALPQAEVPSAPSDLADVLCASGSTKTPKGVMHSHTSALSFIDWRSEALAPTANGRVSTHAPLHFDLSFLDLFVPMKPGPSIALIDDELGRSPKEMARLVAQTRLTVWYSTPSIMRGLVDYGRLEQQTASALCLVLFAGEVFPQEHLDTFEAIWPHPRYYSFYGSTETNAGTCFESTKGVGQPRSAPLPVGAAFSGDELRIVGLDGAGARQ